MITLFILTLSLQTQANEKFCSTQLDTLLTAGIPLPTGTWVDAEQDSHYYVVPAKNSLLHTFTKSNIKLTNAEVTTYCKIGDKYLFETDGKYFQYSLTNKGLYLTNENSTFAEALSDNHFNLLARETSSISCMTLKFGIDPFYTLNFFTDVKNEQLNGTLVSQVDGSVNDSLIAIGHFNNESIHLKITDTQTGKDLGTLKGMGANHIWYVNLSFIDSLSMICIKK